jgi:hypothetical protein
VYLVETLRSCGEIHFASGRRAIPAISTLRDRRSMMKSTKYRTRPVRVSTSTLKKSVAAIAPQRAFKKVSHDIP